MRSQVGDQFPLHHGILKNNHPLTFIRSAQQHAKCRDWLNSDQANMIVGSTQKEAAHLAKISGDGLLDCSTAHRKLATNAPFSSRFHPDQAVSFRTGTALW
jgi:hypothetical protein